MHETQVRLHHRAVALSSSSLGARHGPVTAVQGYVLWCARRPPLQPHASSSWTREAMAAVLRRSSASTPQRQRSWRSKVASFAVTLRRSHHLLPDVPEVWRNPAETGRLPCRHCAPPCGLVRRGPPRVGTNLVPRLLHLMLTRCRSPDYVGKATVELYRAPRTRAATFECFAQRFVPRQNGAGQHGVPPPNTWQALVCLRVSLLDVHLRRRASSTGGSSRGPAQWYYPVPTPSDMVNHLLKTWSRFSTVVDPGAKGKNSSGASVSAMLSSPFLFMQSYHQCNTPHRSASPGRWQWTSAPLRAATLVTGLTLATWLLIDVLIEVAMVDATACKRMHPTGCNRLGPSINSIARRNETRLTLAGCHHRYG